MSDKGNQFQAPLAGISRLRACFNKLERVLIRSAPVLVCWAALGAVFVGIGYGTFTAGGSDSSGYVSQARLWIQGDLHAPVPLNSLVWWNASEWIFSPLGYRPATVTGQIVPTYAPGLPITMAIFSAVGGEQAVYYVVPFFGAAVVWLTYLVGCLLVAPLTASAAAILILASPAFLFQLVQPMSDVPVVAWFLAATWMSWTVRTLSGWMCVGLFLSGAIMTRPNLLPLAILFVFVPFLRDCDLRSSIRSSIACIAGMLPAVIFVALLNTHLYGSPLESGYGSVSSLYSSQNVLPNLERYSVWLIDSQSPLVLLGVAALFFISNEGALSGLKSRRFVWFLLTFSAFMFCCYLPYQQFQEWWYLRFVLSAFPFLILLATVVMRAILRLFIPNYNGIALVVLTSVLVFSGFDLAKERGTFDLRLSDERYIAAAEWIEKQNRIDIIPAAMQHSGSLNYYTQRPVVRYDLLGQRLDEFTERLTLAGFSLYLVVDVWERDSIRRSATTNSKLAFLDWDPVARPHPDVRIYDLSGRLLESGFP